MAAPVPATAVASWLARSDRLCRRRCATTILVQRRDQAGLLGPAVGVDPTGEPLGCGARGREYGTTPQQDSSADVGQLLAGWAVGGPAVAPRYNGTLDLHVSTTKARPQVVTCSLGFKLPTAETSCVTDARAWWNSMPSESVCVSNLCVAFRYLFWLRPNPCGPASFFWGRLRATSVLNEWNGLIAEALYLYLVLSFGSSLSLFSSSPTVSR